MDDNKIPRVLLIGAGAFGKNYLLSLKKLDEQKQICFLGVVVKTEKSQKELSERYVLPVWTELANDLLKQTDAVFIVTPPETHTSLAKQCLPYCHVFIEKPIAETSSEAKELSTLAEKYSRIFMIGHIFRFHPVIKKLKSIFSTMAENPSIIRGWFTNPRHTDNGRDISLEMLHYYDIADYLFEEEPTHVVGQIRDRMQVVSLRYPCGIDAIFELGWTYEEKKRILDFLFPLKKRIRCDLSKNTITIFEIENNQEHAPITISCPAEEEPLDEEISTFIHALNNNNENNSFPSAEVGARVVKIAESVSFLPKKGKPSIAIIGGGIFGVNCAIELGKHYKVTLFERNKDILQEASFINQYRHHWGYHYPRSVDTVQDIIKSTESFEALYNKAIIRNFPTYYCVAKEGSNVTPQEYIKFCEDNGLPFVLEDPDPQYVNMNMISASLKTLEPIYDFDLLHTIINSYLFSNQNITLQLRSEIIGGTLEEDGMKTLTIKQDETVYHQSFDFVINVTYANLNKFAQWFHFPLKPLRLELVEALIVKLPIPKISFAFMDGPFTNMVPTSKDNLFTLVHIKHSILHRDVPKDGLIPEAWKHFRSQENCILEESKKWMPILAKAEVVEKRYVFRGVNAYREYDDARPSDIMYHGFGCWSILGGKIINSVFTAQKIREEITNYSTPHVL